MSTKKFKKLNIHEISPTSSNNNYQTSIQITPNLKNILITPNNGTTITPGKLACSPIKQKAIPLSPLSTAKMTNFKTITNTNFTSCYSPSTGSKMFCPFPSLSKKSKPSLTSTESRNKLVQYKEDNNISFKPKTFEEILDYQEKNLLVPISEKDNENFKLLTMKKIKKKSLPPYKSAKKSEENKIESRKSLDSAIEYSLVKKKKIVHSTKKNLYIILTLYNDKDKPYQFPLFRDKDIGIYEYWQAHIVESKVDEDIDTDDEQLQIANSYNISELKEGIKEIREKGFEQLENKKLPRCSK